MNDSSQRDSTTAAEPVDRDTLASEYFERLPFAPYPVQEEALLAYFTAPQGVLVCAPTGTGKTLIAEAAVYEALRGGTQMIYTTPLIALTDQKLDELRQSATRWGFGPQSIGLVTGNRRVNPEAPVLVVVAEILLNRLLHREAFDFSRVSAVVMDEFHSFNDPQRGIVWELSLALLPPHVRTLLLSATVGNAIEFTQWLWRAHQRRVQLVQSSDRKIPLQFQWIDDQLLADFSEQIAEGPAEQRRTPALLFCFNRAQCWTVAELLKGKKLIDKERQAELADYLNAAPLGEGAGPKLKSMLMRGVGVHHAGILPRYRRIVEELFQRKLLSFCVCTETLSAGINLPARSVVLPSLLKGPRGKMKLVDPATAHQIFGRAGRPQFDDRGFVYALAHEDDVQYLKWKLRYDQIPEDTKDPGLLRAKKQLKKKMPRRNPDVQYWSEQQFFQLRDAPSPNLRSRGNLPWRLLAYLLDQDPQVQPLRELVSRRLLDEKDRDEAQRELNRMLITLWTAGYVQLDPKPVPKSPSTGAGGGSEDVGKKGSRAPLQSPSPAEPAGLFGHLLAGIEGSNRSPQTGPEEPAETKTGDSPAAAHPPLANSAIQGATLDLQARGFEVDTYKPLFAHPTSRLPVLLQLRSLNPLYGVYLADQLAIADPHERMQALESVLEVPATVARLVRVPSYDDLPAGTLAKSRLDPLLLQLGLATPAELGSPPDDAEDPAEDDRDRRRRMFFDSQGEDRVWPLTIGEKILRLFRNDFPRVDDFHLQPVWIAGELLEYGGDFNAYVTANKLQKEEGVLFRHLLRLILLLDEMANIPPLETTPETWEDPLDDWAELLTETCRKVDPESTDEALEIGSLRDDLLPTGRRKPTSFSPPSR